MIHNEPAGVESTGTTTDQDENDCACTPLQACWQHYRDGDRGRPAVRRHTEDA